MKFKDGDILICVKNFRHFIIGDLVEVIKHLNNETYSIFKYKSSTTVMVIPITAIELREHFKHSFAVLLLKKINKTKVYK